MTFMRRHCKTCGGAKWYVMQNNKGEEYIVCCECEFKKKMELTKKPEKVKENRENNGFIKGNALIVH